MMGALEAGPAPDVLTRLTQLKEEANHLLEGIEVLKQDRPQELTPTARMHLVDAERAVSHACLRLHAAQQAVRTSMEEAS